MPAIPDTIRSKGVHIKMDRETHMNFRIKLVELGLTMQEAFEEFAKMVGDGNLSANNLLQRFKREQVRAELATVGLQPLKNRNRKPRRLSELDAEGLYDLINEGPEKDEDPSQSGGRDEAA